MNAPIQRKTTIPPLRCNHLMTTKFLALMSVVGLATVCVLQAQSPTPSESPESPSPAEKAASPSPLGSPTASPKAKPTPKKAKAERKPHPAASPVPAGRTTEEAAKPPAAALRYHHAACNSPGARSIQSRKYCPPPSLAPSPISS